MKRLRIWCLLLFAWMFVFYNIERLLAPINLASFVYVLAACAALPLIVAPMLHRVPLAWLLTAPLPAVLLLKGWQGYPIGGTHLPLTITEVGAVILTLWLARQIGRGFEEFRQSVAASVAGGRLDRSQPFQSGQGELYREVRRARCYDRPLALLACSISPESVSASLDRFTRELQAELAHTHARARLVELLAAEMKDCDVLTHRDGHFVAVLPETDGKTADRIAARLVDAVQQRLGLELKIGVSLFPEEEVTFVKLLETAEERMAGGAHAPRALATDQTAAGQPDLLALAAHNGRPHGADHERNGIHDHNGVHSGPAQAR